MKSIFHHFQRAFSDANILEGESLNSTGALKKLVKDLP